MNIPRPVACLMLFLTILTSGAVAQSTPQDSSQDQRILTEVKTRFAAEHAFDGMSISPSVRHGIAVQEKKNIVIVGSTGSGKTTLVNAVLDTQYKLAPNDRTILIEDTPELQCNVKNHVSLLSTDSFPTLSCLKACMRLTPKRIVLGEVRGKEAHTMLKAWNTGHPGGLATFHANDARGGLSRLESLVGESPEANGPQQRFIAEAVDLLMFIDADWTLKAGRKVREVLAVTGFENGDYITHRL